MGWYFVPIEFIIFEDDILIADKWDNRVFICGSCGGSYGIFQFVFIANLLKGQIA